MKRTDREEAGRGTIRVLLDTGIRTEKTTGIGNYGRYLYEALRSGKDTGIEAALTDFDGGASKTKARLKYLLHMNSRTYARQLKPYDLVHYTNYAMPLWKPKGIRTAVTVHDLASFVCPETLPKSYVRYNRWMVRHALRKADCILTVSESVRKEIAQRWPQKAFKVKAVYPGTYHEFSDAPVPERYESEQLRSLSPQSFFLFVGTVEARKNLGIALKAFLALKERKEAEGFRFVLAGKSGLGWEEYDAIRKSSPYGGEILPTGYLPSGDIRKLYAEAAAYIFPTKYEGFGSPQLECMENHLPLICSDIPTNREISGDYALFFSLDSQEELEQRMRTVIRGEEDREKMNRVADAVCRQFRWENLAEDYRAAYRDTVKGKNGER